MDSAQSNSGVLRVVSAIVGSKYAGFDVVQEACDLAVADGRLNWWLASTKDSQELALTEQNWLDALDQYERILADVSSAWEGFRTYEWPRGEVEAWTRHSDAFRLALRNARMALDDIGRVQGRTNQRRLVEGPDT
jgi:hypothetical protein